MSRQIPRHRTTYSPLTLWLLGGSLVVILTALLVRSESGRTPQPSAGPAAPASTTPPDLSTMTPQERFDRLYDRVITAAQTGDQATVEQFTPMAIAAFDQLDKPSADPRYHLAMLYLHTGDLAAAQAQADAILTSDPDHLFSYVIGGAIARWTKDDAMRGAMYREFLRRYQAQVDRGLPEYLEHRTTLEELKKTAEGELPSS